MTYNSPFPIAMYWDKENTKEEWFLRYKVTKSLKTHKNSKSYEEVIFKIEKIRMLFDQKFTFKFLDFMFMLFPLFSSSQAYYPASLNLQDVDKQHNINLQNVIHIKKFQVFPILFYFQYLPFVGGNQFFSFFFFFFKFHQRMT